MKHILKKVVLFIYLCLVTITISCETEKEVLETTKQPIVKARKEIFKSLRENDTFNKVYLKLETQRQIAVTNRSSMEDLYNFHIKEETPINVVTVDDKTYYNILIERDVENDTFYENLLLKVIPTETGEKTSGYIVKYTPLYNNNNEVITTNKEITALFGKYSNNCYLVYTYGGYFDGQGEWKPTLDVSMYCTHGGGGGDGGSGGEGGASSGGGSSGGGILGGTEQNTNAPPPPQNQNGQVNPQDVVVMSVLSENLEVVTTDPCIKANLLKNDSIFKAKLNDLKISATNNNFETTNVLSKNNLNVETNQYNYSIVNGNANSPSANYLFYPSISVGMLHNHYGNLLSIFTIQDLIDMYNIVKDPQVNSEELVFGLVTKAGTVYLITISDKEKFIKFGNKNLLKYSDYVYLESEVNKNYEIRTDRTNDQNELGFIKMLKDFDVGVNFLKGNTTDFNSWERKEIDKRNKVLTINCN